MHGSMIYINFSLNTFLYRISRARRCPQSRRGFEPHSAQWYFILLPRHFYLLTLNAVELVYLFYFNVHLFPTYVCTHLSSLLELYSLCKPRRKPSAEEQLKSKQLWSHIGFQRAFFFTSRKHTYTILTLLNPTFI